MFFITVIDFEYNTFKLGFCLVIVFVVVIAIVCLYLYFYPPWLEPGPAGIDWPDFEVEEA